MSRPQALTPAAQPETGGGARLPLAPLGLTAAALAALVALDARLSLFLLALIWGPLLLARDPRVGVALLAFSCGVNVAALADPVFVSLPQLAAILVIASVALREVMAPWPRRAGRLWAGCGFLFVAAALPSFLHAVSRSAALVGFAQLLLVALTIHALVRWLDVGDVAAEEVVRFLVLGALVSTLPAFAQFALRLGPESFVRYGFMRVYSTYGQPNAYGHYLAAILPLCLALVGRDRRYLAAAAVLGLALLMTTSRASIGAAALGLLVFFVLRRARGWAGIVAAALLLLAVAVPAGALVARGLVETALSGEDWSLQQRLLALAVTWTAILERPVLGYGLGSFELLLSRIAVRDLEDELAMPHNFPLEVWFETGLLALLALLALAAAYYVRSVRACLRGRDGVLAGFIASFTAMLVASLAGTLIVRGIEEVFALVVATSAMLVARSREAGGG